MSEKINLLIFKRDLRIEDNRTLRKCFEESEKFIPVFIFNPEIFENKNDVRLSFIAEAIRRIREKMKVYVFLGTDQEILEKILQKYRISKVFTSLPLTISGKNRNNKIKELLDRRGVDFVEVFDNVLCDFRKLPYKKVYTHFYNEWKENLDLYIGRDYEYNLKVVEDEEFDNLTQKVLDRFLINRITKWSYDFGFRRLEEYDFSKYSELRNDLGEDYSSKLSPYIRFGIISIRKIYSVSFDKSESFVKELAWREFWYHISYNFPEIRQTEFQENKRSIAWENNEDFMEAFFEARTGYPIIDAAIVQLKQENWMHNRARLIVGSFLTKDLLVDWRIGEKFFSEYLLDYDESINIGNWQWIASVGPDPKPIRIFNPIIQAQKFDPHANYIKKYLPELSKIEPHKLHDPIKYSIPYYTPIVIHSERIEKIKRAYGMGV